MDEIRRVDLGESTLHYIIIDLEWNTAYSKKLGKYINEIIEIGAVKLNEDLKITSEFSSFIKPQIQKKLRSRVKQLTNITNDDIKTGESFNKVIKEFSKWIGEDDCVVLSWGNMDIRVMYENIDYFIINKVKKIPFIKYYADLQQYCMDALKLPKSQQISLNNAAELLQINLDNYVLHRALIDSEISATCFAKTKHKLDFNKYIKNCNEEFYDRLFFKPFVIKELDSPYVDKSIMNCKCTQCGKQSLQIDEWHFINGYFRTYYKCKSCNIKMRVNIQFKKYYDRVNVKKSIKKLEHKDKKNNTEKKEDE